MPRVIYLKSIIVDYRIDDEEKMSLKALDYDVLICPPSKNLYEAVNGHPDMLLHVLDDKNILVHKDMDNNFIDKLRSFNLNVIFSKNSLQSKYPLDIMLNAVNIENYFIHSLNFTDPVLLSNIRDKKAINVKQGYTKCSTAIISNSAIMTSDISIAKAMYNEKFDVLLLPPGDIILPGLDYGFIGGCCGFLEKNLLAFYGDLNYYAYGSEVSNFLNKYKVEPVFLRNGKLMDRGSIFSINVNN